MQRYRIWYTLQLKAWMKRRASWIQTAGIVCLLLLLSLIFVPTVDNTVVGVCAQDAYAQRVAERLQKRDSVFDFVLYSDETAMRETVTAGMAECGFVFDRNFGRHVAAGDLDGQVTFISTPFTVKGEVAKETVYAAFFELYSEEILEKKQEELFDTENREIRESLLQAYRRQLEHSDMFQVKMETVDVLAGAKVPPAKTYPVQGMAGLMVFVCLWMACGKKFEGAGNAVQMALDRRRRLVFQYLGYLASATVPAVIGVLLIVFSPQSRGMIREIVYMAIFAAGSSLWMLAVGRFIKNSTTFAAWLFAVALFQVLSCPVVIDLAQYVPALEYVSRIFPLGWYV